MAPFRPSNLNKRAYPGNASVVGPTRNAAVGFTTTTCCQTYNTLAACSQFCQPILGCRCVQNYCACPCCDICCSCQETLCDRTVPSGMWKSSEQYEAKKRDAWGVDTCSCGAATCLCCFNIGRTSCNNTTLSDCFAFTTCITGDIAYAAAPSAVDCCDCFASGTSTSTSWLTNACACVAYGNFNWFVPSCAVLKNAGYACRSYWDSYRSSTYWSSTERNANYAHHGRFNDGCFCQNGLRKDPGFGGCQFTRAFRCISF